MTKEPLPWEDPEPHPWTCPVCWTGGLFILAMVLVAVWAVSRG